MLIVAANSRDVCAGLERRGWDSDSMVLKYDCVSFLSRNNTDEEANVDAALIAELERDVERDTRFRVRLLGD